MKVTPKMVSIFETQQRTFGTEAAIRMLLFEAAGKVSADVKDDKEPEHERKAAKP